MTNRRFDRLFGGPPRSPEARLEQRHMDLAASIQAVTEEAVLRMGRHVHQQTGERNLVLAGGVALNCVANGRLLREGPFDQIWIQPAAGDAGGALGAAHFTWHQLLDRSRQANPGDSQQGSLLGPSFTSEEIVRYLSNSKTPFRKFYDDGELCDHVAELLDEGKAIGWFQGRMEFGPRALGSRSILGDARSPTMQATLNLKVKFRESFRPFAPIVLREQASEWFDIREDHDSPYMLIVAPVREEHRRKIGASDLQKMQESADLMERVNVARSSIPAVTHVDYSARLQTVDAQRHGRLHHLMQKFHRRTGCPVLVNTSFNVRGEPIVCTPIEAMQCFLATDIDVLVMEDVVINKEDLTKLGTRHSNMVRADLRRRHLAQFALD